MQAELGYGSEMVVLYVMCQSANINRTEGIECRKIKFFICFPQCPPFFYMCGIDKAIIINGISFSAVYLNK